MIGYKVVAIEGGKRVSAVCRNTKVGYISPYEVEYQEGTESVPRLGKLFAFLDQTTAERWLRTDKRLGKDYTQQVRWDRTGFQDFEIWEVELKNPTPCKEVAYYLDQFELYWRGKDCALGNAVGGSVNCDSIILNKCVGKYPNVPLEYNGEKEWQA